MKERTTDRPLAVWLAALLVAAVTFFAFSPALTAGFVTWDDDKNFLNNLHYRGLGPTQLHWMWTTFHLGHYVPLSWMTLGVDYTLWGMNPEGYHLTSLLFHCANAVLVFFLALRVLPFAVSEQAPSPGIEPPSFAASLQECGPAALAALLFAIHPLRVESVAWVTERRDVLSLLFMLASALLYLRSIETDGRRRIWYALSVLLFVCALLSKAISLTLPALLLILNVYPLKRLGAGGRDSWRNAAARGVYLELAPFVILALAAAGMTFVALPHLAQLSISQKIAVSAYSLAFYLWKTFVPLGLAPLYTMPRRVDPAAVQFVVGYCVVVLASAGAWAGRKRWPGVAAGWLAFLVAVTPMLGLVQNGPQIAADRYTYFATPVLGLLVSGAITRLRGASREVAFGVASIAIVVLGTLTWNQTRIWHDSTSLWTQVLRVEPQSPMAHNNLGNQLLLQKQLNDAVAQYRQSLAAAPDYSEAHNNLGVALSRQGKFGDAIMEYQRALATSPTNDEAQANWGIALDAMGRPAESLEHFQRAMAMNKENADAEVNWGNALIKLGRIDDAILLYQRALELRPDAAKAHLNWGVALARQGKLQEAIGQFRETLVLEPNSPEARDYLAKTTEILGTKH